MFIVCVLLFFIVVCYVLATFTNFPILSDMRKVWIETAMTTADHQWLATKFFPKFVIDESINNRYEDNGIVGITDLRTEKTTNLLNKDNEIEYDLETVKEGKIVFTDNDEFGNKVVVNDKEQGIKIVEVSSTTYTGKLVFIDDPSRVIVGETKTKGGYGCLILDYLEDYDAIVGINANGFSDPNGQGKGGEIIGCSVSNGKVWTNGAPFNAYTTIGFDENDRLVVGKLESAEKYNLRDAGQYKPALIIDGEILFEGTAGWGMQPRTIVAQREDGVVMFLVVDGRKPGYSIGITMEEAAKLLKKYGAVTAAACDGGSSSVLAYDGEIINKPSTPMVTGRYLPNAFLVKRK